MEFQSKLGFRADYAPCNPSELADFEATLLGGRLPPDYRTFLLEWNGGYFDATPPESPTIRHVGFLLKDEVDDPGDVGRLFGLFDAKNGHDLRSASEGYGFRAAVPRDYIVIGHGGAWDQICISVQGEDFGRVYYWTPGEPWPDEPEPTREFLRPISKSFREFWDELYLLPDEF